MCFRSHYTRFETMDDEDKDDKNKNILKHTGYWDLSTEVGIGKKSRIEGVCVTEPIVKKGTVLNSITQKIGKKVLQYNRFILDLNLNAII